MNAIERLKRDHKILRSKLDVLEAALRMGPETWYVLREVCYTLSRQLQNHLQREEALVDACRAELKDEPLARVVVEHRDEPERLRTLNRLFLKAEGHSLQQVRPVLQDVVEGLRRHMDEEEQELFPLLAQHLAAREARMPTAPEPLASPIDEVMTVNRLIQLYPRTKRVFEQFFVNIPYEGCDCLDEVAWRHGMESRELLHTLEQAIASQRPELAPSAPEAAPCGCP
jgi:hemerythrin-like domain-containing protein